MHTKAVNSNFSPKSGCHGWAGTRKILITDHPDHLPIFISFLHLPQSIASSLCKLRAWQSFCTTSVQVILGLPVGLEPSTSHSIDFFTQSVSSFGNTCPYHRNLFCCSISIISSIPSHSLNSLLGALSFTLTLHIHLTILISARWNATSFSFLTGQVSLPCSILLRTQLLYSLPLLINDISLLVSNVTNYLNLFHPIQILTSTAASASPSTLNVVVVWFYFVFSWIKVCYKVWRESNFRQGWDVDNSGSERV